MAAYRPRQARFLFELFCVNLKSVFEANLIINIDFPAISQIENRPTKMRFRLPVKLIAEVAHWLDESECAELDPVSKQFDSFTKSKALEWHYNEV